MDEQNGYDVTALLADHQMFHSDLQIDSFITSKAGGTVYGCYKQALRELWKRWRGLKGLYAERELLLIDIDELESGIPLGEFAERRRVVHLAQKRLHAVELDKSIGETEREFARFYQQAASLKPIVGELTPARRAELDEDMWCHHLLTRAATDYMECGRLKGNTAELFASLPARLRKRIAPQMFPADGPQRLIEWFLAYEPTLPDAAAIPTPDIKALIGES